MKTKQLPKGWKEVKHFDENTLLGLYNDDFTCAAIKEIPEYEFEFIVEGSSMTYKINGATILEATDTDLAWGTCGVRLDYGDMSVDYVRISDV